MKITRINIRLYTKLSFETLIPDIVHCYCNKTLNNGVKYEILEQLYLHVWGFPALPPPARPTAELTSILELYVQVRVGRHRHLPNITTLSV